MWLTMTRAPPYRQAGFVTNECRRRAQGLTAYQYPLGLRLGLVLAA